MIATAFVAVAAAPPAVFAHGGDEMAVDDLKMQPASTLAQQALAELRINNNAEEAAVRLDAAMESKDTSAVDMGVLARAMKTVDEGNPQDAIPLIDESLSRPQGATQGAALHEAGREFQPGTDTQEIVAIIVGACLLVVGLVALHPWRRTPATRG